MPEDLSKLCKYINYEFKDRSLLKEAMTHTSYATEYRLKYSYQRLEFLGDTVLDMVVSDHIYRKLPECPEGDLTKIRSAMVNRQAVAKMGESFRLGEFAMLGRGERMHTSDVSSSLLGDLFEALLGAVYLDGGMEAATTLVMTALGSRADDPGALLPDLNPKGTLQEYAQSAWKVKPVYETLKKLGPDHHCVFQCRVSVKEFSAESEGTSIHGAERAAAALLIKKIAEQHPAIKDFS